jgi:hypothetical protein
MFWINLSTEYERLCRAQEALAAADAPGAFTGVPAVSGWSIAQHAHHATHVNTKMMVAARELAEGDTAGAAQGHANVVGWLLLTLQRMPRGRGRSPRAFVPPDDLDAEQLARALTQSQRALERVEPHLPTLRQSLHRLPHPVMGALTPSQWFRAARLHAEHHHHIMRDLARHLG